MGDAIVALGYLEPMRCETAKTRFWICAKRLSSVSGYKSRQQSSSSSKQEISMSGIFARGKAWSRGLKAMLPTDLSRLYGSDPTLVTDVSPGYLRLASPTPGPELTAARNPLP